MIEYQLMRNLLVKAWRERWTDVQFGINVREVLPRYISGDIYHMSKCLLEQALVGTLPNRLILSYLMHSLGAQLVSYGGVLESIIEFRTFLKTHCIKELLNIMDTLTNNVYSKGKPEDCLMLSTSLLGALDWVTQSMIYSVEQVESSTSKDHLSNFEGARHILQTMCDSEYIMCMLHLGTRENSNTWVECNSKISQLERILIKVNGIDDRDSLIKTLSNLREKKPYTHLGTLTKHDIRGKPFSHVVYSIIIMEVMFHLTRDHEFLCHQLLFIMKFKGMSLSDLYLEMLTACFIGLGREESSSFESLKWASFTYIKLPTIIANMHDITHSPSVASSEELVKAFQLLSKKTSLLELADIRVKCNCLEYILNEFTSIKADLYPKLAGKSLVTERDAKTILATRLNGSSVYSLQKNDDGQTAKPILVITAYPTVVTILKTVHSNRNSESFMNVLSLLVCGKSRELVLIAAAASGNLHLYAQQFVKINEQSRIPDPNESPQMLLNRTIVFDISFLLLCHISLTYGTELVVSKNKDTFIEKWISLFIPEVGKVKSIDDAIHIEQSKVEEFVRRVDFSDQEKLYNIPDFSEICKGSLVTIKEIMSLPVVEPQQNIKDIIAKSNFYMNCLSLCQAGYLCSYIQHSQVGSEGFDAAFSYLKFIKNMPKMDSPKYVLPNYKERTFLMQEIVDNMIDVVQGNITLLKPQKVDDMETSSDTNSLNLNRMLKLVWEDFRQPSGLISHSAFKTSHHLMRLGKVTWFVSAFTQAALDCNFSTDLTNSIDICFGIFHFDIVECTNSFLVHVLPQYITGTRGLNLGEQQCRALANLTVRLIISSWTSLNIPLMKSDEGMKNRGMKRTLSGFFKEESHKSDAFDLTDSSSISQEIVEFISNISSLFKAIAKVCESIEINCITVLIVEILRNFAAMPHSTGLISLIPPSTLMHLSMTLPKCLSFEFAELLVLGAPDPSHGLITYITETGRNGDYSKKMHIYPGDMLLHNNAKVQQTRQSTAKLLCSKRNLQLIDDKVNQ